MAGRPPMMRCFACNGRFDNARLRRIDGDLNEEKRQIAIDRRAARDLPVILINPGLRLCLNCDQTITDEIHMMQRDPNRLRMNVVIQAGSRSCIICNAVEDVHMLSVPCRVNVYIQQNIFIPRGVRACAHHLDRNGLLDRNLLLGLRYINRACNVRGTEMLAFLECLRERASEAKCLDDNDLNDEDFECISPISKQQFDDLYAYCEPVIQNGKMRHISRKDLLTFLSKLKHGLSDSFMKVIFDYSTRQTVSSVIDYVRRSLALRFSRENIGLESITRDDYIAQHVTEYSNILYNPQPARPVAIAIADATYAYLQKSSNFQVLRQSYCLHKHRHLLKIVIIVGPDGRILCILGPYSSDSRNNDAQDLIHHFQQDVDSLRNWFHEGDIILADRGYRDAVPFLENLGIDVRIPPFLQRGQRQLTTEEANESRKITKGRWVVEGRNGHFRSVFKFFAGTINMMHAVHLNEFYRIAGAILNRYRPPLLTDGATAEAAHEVLRRSQIPNAVQARVEADNLRRRNAQWRRLRQRDLPDFPILDLEYLRDLTIGVYQVSLARSYVQDKLIRENDEEFQLDEHFNERGFIRIAIYSRFRNVVRHQTFIQYRSINDRTVADAERDDPVLGYYCDCQTGARTLGCCAHIASVIWFLGYARHQENIVYPDDSLLHTTLDAANRAAGEAAGHLNDDIAIVHA